MANRCKAKKVSSVLIAHVITPESEPQSTRLDMDNSRWPVCEGLVNKKKVKVLRDSGCSSVLVRNTLFNEGDMLGKFGLIKLATNEVRETPLASIYIDTPYYKGHVDALVLENPIYDLIIGNTEKALPPFSPDPNWSWREIRQ